MLRPGPAGATSTRSATRCPTGRVAGRAVAAPAGADRRPEPGRAARRRRASGSRERPGAARPAGAAVAVRADAAAALGYLAGAARRSPTQRDVHLFLLHPSPALWDDGRRGARANGPPITPARRPDRDAAGQPAARVLGSRRPRAAARARDAGEGADRPPRAARAPNGRHAARADPGGRPRRPPAARRRRCPASPTPGRCSTPTTAAIQIHACHGRARQVEVLRDAILHLLADDPTLEPRDVIVMCPDIETFAPLIQATFGAGRTAADDDEDEPSRRRHAAARPAGQARRPLAAPDQPGARRRQPAARARRPAR